ncbi:unnamed protein product [Cuscuta epithymum]|uniref:RNase H type-1 domain-containing protein n=1 Tax=Cuscuta epithymum TaxID=186058 RepID=A0AAV0CN01_9ASTE|nr:unnamed protein product [Cuscuta epithymum]
MHQARSLVESWTSAQMKEHRAGTNLPLGSKGWSCPGSGFLKVYVDASIDGHCHGLSWVVRNAAGEFLAGGSKKGGGRCSPLEAELLGIREVLSWLKAQAWDSIEVESDTLKWLKLVVWRSDRLRMTLEIPARSSIIYLLLLLGTQRTKSRIQRLVICLKARFGSLHFRVVLLTLCHLI